MMLLATALFGLIVPNGLFLYWLIYEYPGLSIVLQNKPAVALMIDALTAVAVLAYYFARQGQPRWTWFIALSLVGGLGFSVPLYIWLLDRYRLRAHAGSL
jgi:hypothetical protein